MIPVYAKLAIVGAGAFAGITGFILFNKHTAAATVPGPLAPQIPTSAPKANAPAAAILPNGQTQAQIDAATNAADAELAQMLDAELASF